MGAGAGGGAGGRMPPLGATPLAAPRLNPWEGRPRAPLVTPEKLPGPLESRKKKMNTE